MIVHADRNLKVSTILDLVLPPVLEICLTDVGTMICLSSLQHLHQSWNRVVRSLCMATHRNNERPCECSVDDRGNQHQVIVRLEGLMLEAPEQRARENDKVG